MIRAQPRVSNPLTVIAIFATIAEMTGAAVVPAMAPSSQETFVWFLVLFPFVLVFMFFLTLNFNHRVLYAPSDYSDEENFLRVMAPASSSQRIWKLKKDTSEEREREGAEKKNEDNIGVDRRRAEKYGEALLAEELVVRELTAEFGIEFRRDLVVGGLGKDALVDAAAVQHDGRIIAAEIKRLDRGGNPEKSLSQLIKEVEKLRNYVVESFGADARVILAIVVDDLSMVGSIRDMVDMIVETRAPSVEVKVFGLDNLEEKYL